MTLPPILALPGTLLDARSLSAMLNGLNGLNGPSGPNTRTMLLGTCDHIDDEVERLLAELALLGPEPAVWLGHSLGGIVALHAAARHPQRLAGLVLLGANARAGRDSGEARRAAQWTLAQQEGLPALAHSKLAPGYGLAQGDAALADLVDQAQAVGLARFAHQLAYARQRPGLLTPRLPLSVPVLALSGELDTLCPPAMSDEIIGLVSAPHHAIHHRLMGAGHLFPMQQPSAVAAPLHTFLAQLKNPAHEKQPPA